MLDTMTMTKVVGGVCGALLIYLMGNWAAESLYHVGADGHGDGEHVAGYAIATDDEGHGGGEAETIDVAALLAAGDAAKGEKVFGKCKACHKIEDGANGTGPHLHAVVGRAVDSVAGYGYSGALVKVADVWSPEHLFGFLENPKGYAPGTKMGFAGLKNVEDRANIIAYLAMLN